MADITREEIEHKKKERATAKRMMQDSLRWWVGFQSVPSIMIMVGTLVGSAYYLKSEALAVVTGLVATVTMGLINVLTQMTAPSEKPSELAKSSDNLHHAHEKELSNTHKQMTSLIELLAETISEKIDPLYNKDEKPTKKLISDIIKPSVGKGKK
tara:strand:- start:579 stop:1043 length:465 start_codon:yes stop_codon:yes gene_type:complete